MNIIIDGKTCPAVAGETILTVAARSGIKIPSLCHSDALPGQAACRVCVVEVVEKDWSKVVTSCVYPVSGEIEVLTRSPKILALRRTIIKLLAARAPHSEAIQQLLTEYQVTVPPRLAGDSAAACILCGLCVKACERVGPAAIATVSRGVTKKVSTPYDEPTADCVGCGSCARICPTGAITLQQEKTQQTIWGKTFELLECADCGQRFATREQWDYVSRRLGRPDAEPQCDACRKLAVCAQLKTCHR